MISDEIREKWDMQIEVLLTEYGSRLSLWESEFLDSIQMWRSNDRDLTFRQSKKLREIFNRLSV